MTATDAATRPRAPARLAACRSDPSPRGTTNTNRLRRIDRWIAAQSGTAARHRRVRRRPRLRRERRDRARTRTRRLRARAARRRGASGSRSTPPACARARAARGGARGRDALRPRPARRLRARRLRGAAARRPPPAVIRAFNVLRQYEESDVAAPGRAWRRGSRRAGCSSRARATSSGGVASWVGARRVGARARFTISLRRSGLEAARRIVAERLPEGAHPPQRARRAHPRAARRARPGLARARADIGLRAVAAVDRDRGDGAARRLARDRRAASHAARRAHRAVARGGSRLRSARRRAR